MRAAILALALVAGCSTFGTHLPPSRWRASPGGSPPACEVTPAPAVDMVAALLATAVLVGVNARGCHSSPDGDGNCGAELHLANVGLGTTAIAYGISALTGHSRNRTCAGAHRAYHDANPRWSGP